MEGRVEGRVEGRRQGLREAVVDLCEVLALTVDVERQAQLEAMTIDGLVALKLHLKSHRTWL